MLKSAPTGFAVKAAGGFWGIRSKEWSLEC